MSQRDSGYKRKELDCYETPEWVTLALVPHIHKPSMIWEPAAGSGKMVDSLKSAGMNVYASDISDGVDFLVAHNRPIIDAIITNPPYNLATEFIEKALHSMKPFGLVAMLLRTDFDHAKTRQRLFSGCRAFAKKLVLTKRIKWFDDSKGQPSFNHAWFIWDWKHNGPPIIAYDVQDNSIDKPTKTEQSDWDRMWQKPFHKPEYL